MSEKNSVYKILKAINNSFEKQDFNFERDLDLEELKISDYKRELIIESLVDFGYVEGITVFHDLYRDSSIKIEYPRLTSAGMECLKGKFSTENLKQL